LFHGLDFLLVRDDLVVVFRVTLAKLLELRFPLIKHLLALLQQPARLREFRLEVRDFLLGRGCACLKILGLPLGRGRATPGIETSNSPSAAWRATGIVNGDRLIDY